MAEYAMEGVLYLELTSALVRFRFSPDFSEITPFFELPDFFVNFRIRTSNKPCYCPTPKKGGYQPSKTTGGTQRLCMGG